MTCSKFSSDIFLCRLSLSSICRLDYEEIFLDIMKQKFLSGQDTSINYLSIDTDTTLDDHFADVERQNAEDAYFDSSD